MGYFFDLLRPARNQFIQVDSQGYLLTAFRNTSDLTALDRDVIKEIIPLSKRIAKDNLVSIYFRSHVTYDNINNRLDLLLIVKEYDSDLASRIRWHFTATASLAFPLTKMLNLQLVTVNELKLNRTLQFIVKVLCLRIYGKAVERVIKPFRPGNEVIYSLFVIPSKIRDVEEVKCSKPHLIQAACIHLIKHLIRASFEVVCAASNGYTRNLELCNRLFNYHYPQHSNLSNLIYEQLTRDEIDLEALLIHAKDFYRVLEKINAEN